MKLEVLVQPIKDAGITAPVFVFSMPETIEVGVLLINALSGAEVDPYIRGLRRSRFQAVVRHTEYAAGMALAEQVMDALWMQRVQLQGVEVKSIHPRHDPVPFPISEGKHLEISTNFDAIWAK